LIPTRGQFAFHIPPESVSTSLRNPYSPFPGTLIHIARIPQAIAAVLKKYIQKAFGAKFFVFVASDQTSIGGGRKWFEYIITNLKTAKVVLVLVSQESCSREWINFEAGFGDGAEAVVIPLSIKQFSLSKLRFPLLGYNGRPIDDIDGILFDISRETDLVSEKVDQVQYAEEIRAAEANLIYKSIVVTPFVRVQNGDPILHLLSKTRAISI
jgi:hypothetical protein